MDSRKVISDNLSVGSIKGYLSVLGLGGYLSVLGGYLDGLKNPQQSVTQYSHQGRCKATRTPKIQEF